MPFATLLHWIRVTDLEDADPMRARPLVQAALAQLGEEDPRREPLEAIEAGLWEGTVPADQMRALAEDWEHYESEDSLTEGEALEQEFRQLAADLPRSEWHTTFYDQALAAVSSLQEGDHEAFYTTLDTMRARLEEAWEPYYQSPVADEEVTAETVVGHRLLQDGVESWFHALDQLEQAAEQGGDHPFDEALASAQEANRLLVAVQKLARRVKRAASAYD